MYTKIVQKLTFSFFLLKIFKDQNLERFTKIQLTYRTEVGSGNNTELIFGNFKCRLRSQIIKLIISLKEI